MRRSLHVVSEHDVEVLGFNIEAVGGSQDVTVADQGPSAKVIVRGTVPPETHVPGVLVLIGVGAVHHSVGGLGISDAAVAIWIRGLGSALFHLTRISVLPGLGVSVDSGISSLSGTDTVHRNPECWPWKSLHGG